MNDVNSWASHHCYDCTSAHRPGERVGAGFVWNDCPMSSISSHPPLLGAGVCVSMFC